MLFKKSEVETVLWKERTFALLLALADTLSAKARALTTGHFTRNCNYWFWREELVTSGARNGFLQSVNKSAEQQRNYHDISIHYRYIRSASITLLYIGLKTIGQVIVKRQHSAEFKISVRRERAEISDAWLISDHPWKTYMPKWICCQT